MCILDLVMRTQRIGRSVVVLALLAGGCGSSGPSDPHDDATATLSIDPPSTEVLISNGVPATADFTAKLTYPDGESRDVTSEVRFSIDTGYGMFTGSTLQVTAAGKTQVFGTWSDKLASAMVIARPSRLSRIVAACWLVAVACTRAS